MNNKTAIEYILDMAMSEGYLGLDPVSGKFLMEGRSPTTVAKKIVTLLNLEARAREDKNYEAVVLLSSVEGMAQLDQAFRSVVVRKPEAPNEFESLGAPTEVAGISVFKSNILVKAIDPRGFRAGGPCILLYNSDTRGIVNGLQYSIDGVLSGMGLVREEILQNPNTRPAVSRFDPYDLSPVKPVKDPVLGPVYSINLYSPPPWRSCLVEGAFTGWIKQLMEHLFLDREELERVLDWAHYAIVRRNGTMLALAGDRGTGKSTFAAILSHLVGTNYTEYVSEAILTDKFNPQIKSKRLLIFEEVALDENKHVNKIKAWCNTNIALEEKGQDPYTTENYSSMILLVNQLEDLRISPSERRFSIPKLTDVDLKAVMSPDLLNYIQTNLNDPCAQFMDELAAFGNFLLHRTPKYNNQTPIKGEYFFAITEMSLSQWQTELVRQTILQGEIGKPLLFHDIFSRDFTKRVNVASRRDYIDNFLRDYRHKGLQKVGRIIDTPEELKGEGGRSRREYCLMPSTEFLKKFGAKYQAPADEDDL